VSALPCARDATRRERAHDRFVLDIRPMAWQATVIAPAANAEVTVILRVTYHSLEALCRDDDADEVDGAVLN